MGAPWETRVKRRKNPLIFKLQPQKKVLSLVLCLAMMLSVMVVGAGAAFTDQDKIVNTEAVDMCVALNIINGFEDGSFKPEGNITRAQACKMICIALNGGKDPVLGTNATPTFSDIDGHWAEAYIEYCVSEGIVAGVGDGKFNPEGNVTGSQFAKMLLIALGYRADHEGFLGSAWEVNVNVKASAKGLYEDLESMNPAESLSRDNAAQMVWNAMQAKEVEYKYTLATDENGQMVSRITVEDKQVNGATITLLKDKYDGIVEETILIDASYNTDKGEWTYTTNPTGTSNTTPGTTPVDKVFTKATVDYCDLYRQAVKVVYTVNSNGAIDDFVGMISDSNIIATGILDDIETPDYSKNEVEIDNVTYKLSKTITSASNEVYAYLNTTAAAMTTLGTVCPAYAFVAIDQDDDNRIDEFVYFPFDVAQIDYLSSSSITLNGTDDQSTNGSYDLDDVNLYDGADEDDWTVVTAAANANDETLTVEAAEIITGEVTRIKTNSAGNTSAVEVDGTFYDVETTAYAAATLNGDTIKVGDTYDFVVVNGFVFYGEKVAGAVNADNVLYLDKVGALSSGLADGVEAKVYFSDGTSSTVKVTGITINASYTGSVTNTNVTTAKTYVADDYDIVNDNSTPDSDEMFAGDATALLNSYLTAKNALFTYSEKNGEYSLEVIDGNNIGAYDQYNSETSSPVIEDGKTTGKVRFDEDAVIFVNDKDGVKVVSGATVNAWNKITANSVVGLSDKSNGTQYIAIGAIDLGNKVAKSDVRVYGFVTGGISSDKDYCYFTMWNGAESVDVKVDKDDAPTIAKYDFVAFDWVDEATAEADGDDFVIKTALTNAVAITSYTNGDISFSDGGSYDFADEYFVIGVDTNKGEGVEGGKLAVAKNCQIASSHSNCKYANAIYFTAQDGSDTVVEAVFVDTNGMLYSDKSGSKLCTSSVTAGSKTLTAAESTDTSIKAQPDGLYVPGAVGSLTSVDASQLQDIRIFKFVATVNQTYTLSIENSNGKEVLKDTGDASGTNPMTPGPHYFYINVKAGEYAPAASGTGSVTATGDYATKSFKAGDYTYTVTGDDGIVYLSGSFTI